MIEQLALFTPASTRWAQDDDEDIRLGLLRHHRDLSDHQHGWIELDWDTAGGRKRGDLIPAWICCVCGQPEPNVHWLGTNHSCYLIPGCAADDPERKRSGPWQFRLAPEDRWPSGGAR